MLNFLRLKSSILTNRALKVNRESLIFIEIIALKFVQTMM